jgi:hypothetical protein
MIRVLQLLFFIAFSTSLVWAEEGTPAQLTAEEIVLVQTKLRELNYVVRVTGILDDQTRSAIKTLHSDNDMPATDFLTSEELARLKNTDTSSRVSAAIAGAPDGTYSAVWNKSTRDQAEEEAMSSCRRRSSEAEKCTVASRSAAVGQKAWIAAVHCEKTVGRTIYDTVQISGTKEQNRAIDGAYSLAADAGFAKGKCKLSVVVEARAGISQ